MSESVLKKEFREADLQRLRNLVKGRTGEKTSISSGYVKDHVDRKEGDVWEEDERQWTIKNGVKQTISKLQAVRDVALTPLFCPDCKALMKHRYDNQFYKIHRHCFDCHVKFETELKGTGKWDEYQKQVENSEIDGMINNYEIWVDDLLNETNDGFVTELGEVESWSKVNRDKIVKQKEEAIKYLQKLKK